MDHQGEFLNEFSINLGSGKVLHSELLSIMIRLENAANRDGSKIWIEVGSL